MRCNLLLTAALALGLLATPVRADGDAEARAIIDKAAKAHGGADNLAKVKASILKMKGKTEAGGMSIDFICTVSVQTPDKIKVETDVDIMGNKFTSLQILDGNKGWSKLGEKVVDMDKDQMAELVQHMHAHRVANLAALSDKAFKLSLTGESKVNGKAAVGVQVSHKDCRDVSLFFDKETGLIVKTERRSRDVFGNNQEYTDETFYSDYKEFNGIKRATKQTVKRDGKDFCELEITEFEPREKLDDSVFAKP